MGTVPFYEEKKKKKRRRKKKRKSSERRRDKKGDRPLPDKTWKERKKEREKMKEKRRKEEEGAKRYNQVNENAHLGTTERTPGPPPQVHAGSLGEVVGLGGFASLQG